VALANVRYINALNNNNNNNDDASFAVLMPFCGCVFRVSQDVVEAVNLLAQGKRNYMCGEVRHAVSQLQEACRLLYDSTFFSLFCECSLFYVEYF